MSFMLLSSLPPHGACRVVRVCECDMSKRLTGLGITPGARLVRLFHAPGGDPVAYSVRGTAVALRRSDADKIIVEADAGWE